MQYVLKVSRTDATGAAPLQYVEAEPFMAMSVGDHFMPGAPAVAPHGAYSGQIVRISHGTYKPAGGEPVCETWLLVNPHA